VTRAGGGRRLLRELAEWTRHLVFAGLFFYFFTTFAFQSFQVEGGSMLPLLHDGERIFVSRSAYRLEPVGRGDVVVFWYPPRPDRTLVKRVIGVPGDRLSLREGALYLDGQPVDEPYVPDGYRSDENWPVITVPPGYYFVLGDHRTSSDDSRRWGLVPERYIVGRVVLRFWPYEKFGPVPHAAVAPAPLATPASMPAAMPAPAEAPAVGPAAP
jgi:signal peptidase I